MCTNQSLHKDFNHVMFYYVTRLKSWMGAVWWPHQPLTLCGSHRSRDRSLGELVYGSAARREKLFYSVHQHFTAALILILYSIFKFYCYHEVFHVFHVLFCCCRLIVEFLEAHTLKSVFSLEVFHISSVNKTLWFEFDLFKKGWLTCAVDENLMEQLISFFLF